MMIEKIKFYLKNRFVVVVIFIFLFIGISYLYTGAFLPSASTRDFWFYSGLLLLLFSILFVEPFFTSPKNIITNSLPLLLSYIAIKDEFKDTTIWWYTFILILVCITLSIIAIAIQSENESSDNLNNRIADFIRTKIVIVGEGKIIYSIVFLSVIFLYKSELDSKFSQHYFFVMIILWGFILAINPKSLHSKFRIDISVLNADSIGEIFSVQSDNMYLIRIFENKNDVKKFDLVNFKYSKDDHNHKINQGIIFDTYKLNTQKWAKVLCLNMISDANVKLSKNIMYRITSPTEIVAMNENLKIDRLVGVIIEGSKIGVIKFEYSKKNDNLQEGNLLELSAQGKKIFYQVIGGITEFERLENKNESGFITGEAIQLGIWNNENLSFEKFGWIPQINTPLFSAKTDDIEIQPFEIPEYKLGVIPNTKLPSVINLNDAVSHHTALLGITGAGKSFLAKEIIAQLTITGTKVICVDFTGEWKKTMNLLSINSQNLDDFLNPDSQDVGLVELPSLSNTVQVIESTERFIAAIFDKAKAAYEAGSPIKICLVLEEAHTIIPEATFLAVNDFNSKALVNKMGQVALQGRKYGVGLLVIAQRTANVSKTVLTQCNTIICFQAFDETSFTFLGNYIGKDLVQALPNLKRYHAVVTGKAIKSNIPMIVDLERELPNQ